MYFAHCYNTSLSRWSCFLVILLNLIVPFLTRCCCVCYFTCKALCSLNFRLLFAQFPCREIAFVGKTVGEFSIQVQKLERISSWLVHVLHKHHFTPCVQTPQHVMSYESSNLPVNITPLGAVQFHLVAG